MFLDIVNYNQNRFESLFELSSTSCHLFMFIDSKLALVIIIEGTILRRRTM